MPVSLSESQSASPKAEPQSSHLTPGEVALLGLVGATELRAAQSLATLSTMAPELADAVWLMGLAGRCQQFSARAQSQLGQAGVDWSMAMQPYATRVEAFFTAARPTSWPESVLQVYLTHTLAADFVTTTADRLPSEVARLVRQAVHWGAAESQLAARVQAAVAASPDQVGRLSLFARRILGEALGQAQRVAARESDLTGVLNGGAESEASDDLAAVTALMREVSRRHGDRVEALGLFG